MFLLCCFFGVIENDDNYCEDSVYKSLTDLLFKYLIPSHALAHQRCLRNRTVLIDIYLLTFLLISDYHFLHVTHFKESIPIHRVV